MHKKILLVDHRQTFSAYRILIGSDYNYVIPVYQIPPIRNGVVDVLLKSPNGIVIIIMSDTFIGVKKQILKLKKEGFLVRLGDNRMGFWKTRENMKTEGT